MVMGMDGSGGACLLPKPPPLPSSSTGSSDRRGKGKSGAWTAARGLWDRLFQEGYRADVCVRTGNGVIHAHANVLGMASPVMKSMLKLKWAGSRGGGAHRPGISIRGVPHDAVRAFVRFLYSSCYQQKDMDKFVLHLLVLSHVFVIPTLKRECVQQLEQGLLCVDNVVDVFQLAQLCDAPRLCVICRRFILNNFKVISATDGWKVMQKSNPKIEKEILDASFEADSRKQERMKLEERKIYQQLNAVMEALVHVCRDGCRTTRPPERVSRGNQAPCEYKACKGITSLTRHFAGCKTRASGRCSDCRRMWQLLKLHSCLCSAADACKVPLCRQFKEKMQHRNKKDEMRWRLLVNKVTEAKSFSKSASTRA